MIHEKTMEEIKQKTKSLIDTDNSVVITEGKGVGGRQRGKGQIHGDGRRLTGVVSTQHIYRRYAIELYP